MRIMTLELIWNIAKSSKFRLYAGDQLLRPPPPHYTRIGPLLYVVYHPQCQYITFTVFMFSSAAMFKLLYEIHINSTVIHETHKKFKLIWLIKWLIKVYEDFDKISWNCVRTLASLGSNLVRNGHLFSSSRRTVPRCRRQPTLYGPHRRPCGQKTASSNGVERRGTLRYLR